MLLGLTPKITATTDEKITKKNEYLYTVDHWQTSGKCKHPVFTAFARIVHIVKIDVLTN